MGFRCPTHGPGARHLKVTRDAGQAVVSAPSSPVALLAVRLDKAPPALEHARSAKSNGHRLLFHAVSSNPPPCGRKSRSLTSRSQRLQVTVFVPERPGLWHLRLQGFSLVLKKRKKWTSRREGGSRETLS